MTKRASGLAFKLVQEFSTTAPVIEDAEEINDHDNTAAKVNAVHSDDEDLEVNQTSGLRAKNTQLLSDFDPKYSGKKVSRATLFSDEEIALSGSDDELNLDNQNESDDEMGLMFTDPDGSEIESGSDSDQSDDDDDDDDEYDVDISSFVKKASTLDSSTAKPTSSSHDDYDLSDDDMKPYAAKNEQEFSGSDQEVNDAESNEGLLVGSSEDEISEENSDDEDEDEEEGENDETGDMKTVKSSEQTDVEKGQAAQNQIRMWELLLELRIEIQKLLTSANQLPDYTMYDQLKNSQLDQQYITQEDEKAEESCLNLCCKLLDLQRKLEGNVLHETGKKRSYSEIESNISTEFEQAQAVRNDVIQRWDDKTRLARLSSKQKTGDIASQSVLSQISHVLADKDRLISRTQQKRNNIQIIGKTSKSTETKNMEEHENGQNADQVSDGKPSEKVSDLEPEIYNDDDFYQSMLRELIQQKTNQSDDPIIISRQWLEFQNMRRKIKRVVDTRASKGRKLRFSVLPKLVNLMAPVSNPNLWDDSKRDELYSSLFGKKPRYSEPVREQEESNSVSGRIEISDNEPQLLR